MLRTVKLQAYYVPAASVRLLSTTDLMHETGKKLEIDTSYLRLTVSLAVPTALRLPSIRKPTSPRRTSTSTGRIQGPMVNPLLVRLPICLPKMVILGSVDAPQRAVGVHRGNSAGLDGNQPDRRGPRPGNRTSGAPGHANSASGTDTSNQGSRGNSSQCGSQSSPNGSPVSPGNSNLSNAKKELLRWHYRLGHLGFNKIQFLMRSGAISSSESVRRCLCEEREPADGSNRPRNPSNCRR
jgi:GAG-pre-integrase domain